MVTDAVCEEALAVLAGRRLCDLFNEPGQVRHRELVGSFADVALCVQEGDYQGDYFMLVRSARGWGFVSIGYGSCSGCDAVTAAAEEPSFDGLETLRDALRRDVQWQPTAADLAAWLRARDWSTEWNADRIDGEEKFLTNALALLDAEPSEAGLP